MRNTRIMKMRKEDVNMFNTDIELNEQEIRRANAAAGTVMAKLFRAGAIGLKGLGIGVEYSTKIVGKGIQAAGTGIVITGAAIETAGAIGSKACYDKAAAWNEKSGAYDEGTEEGPAECFVDVEVEREVERPDTEEEICCPA